MDYRLNILNFILSFLNKLFHQTYFFDFLLLLHFLINFDLLATETTAIFKSRVVSSRFKFQVLFKSRYDFLAFLFVRNSSQNLFQLQHNLIDIFDVAIFKRSIGGVVNLADYFVGFVDPGLEYHFIGAHQNINRIITVYYERLSIDKIGKPCFQVILDIPARPIACAVGISHHIVLVLVLVEFVQISISMSIDGLIECLP